MFRIVKISKDYALFALKYSGTIYFLRWPKPPSPIKKLEKFIVPNNNKKILHIIVKKSGILLLCKSDSEDKLDIFRITKSEKTLLKFKPKIQVNNRS